MYIKITEVLKAEIDQITEEDCINYVINLVIRRTYEGYITEKKTIYEQLEEELGVEIHPASDEWDRKYNVDFYIEINGKYIGIQIKPTSSNINFISELAKERELQKKSHEKFTKEYGGKVFFVFSAKDGDKKKIVNPEVIGEIREEIERLKKSS